MRDINIKQNLGNIVENNYNYNNKHYTVNYELEEKTLKELVKSKIKEFIMSLTSFAISIILEVITKNYSIDEAWLLTFIIFILLSGLLGLILLLCFISDLSRILKLKKIGKCINFESKSEVFQEFVESLSGKDLSLDKRRIGKLIKNENGRIYEIKGCKCPKCESEPIGYMRPSYTNRQHQYVFVCSENPAHKLVFDFKNKIK